MIGRCWIKRPLKGSKGFEKTAADIFFYKSCRSIENKKNIFFLSLLITTLTRIFYFEALKSGKMINAVSIDKLSKVSEILFTILFLGEAIT